MVEEDRRNAFVLVGVHSPIPGCASPWLDNLTVTTLNVRVQQCRPLVPALLHHFRRRCVSEGLFVVVGVPSSKVRDWQPAFSHPLTSLPHSVVFSRPCPLLCSFLTAHPLIQQNSFGASLLTSSHISTLICGLFVIMFFVVFVSHSSHSHSTELIQCRKWCL